MRKPTPPKVRVITRGNKPTENINSKPLLLVERIGKNISILYGLLIFSTSVFYNGFYSEFNINLFDYITLSEILTLALKELFVFSFLILYFIIIYILKLVYYKALKKYSLKSNSLIGLYIADFLLKWRKSFKYIMSFIIFFGFYLSGGIYGRVMKINASPEYYKTVNIKCKTVDNLFFENSEWILLTEVNNKLLLYNYCNDISVVLPTSDIILIEYVNQSSNKIHRFMMDLFPNTSL